MPVKWVKPEQMHLTLVFMGEVSPSFIQNAAVILKTALNNCPRFKCQLQGLSAFPSISKARVLWTGIENGRVKIMELQQVVVNNLKPLGYVPEKRPFNPHLTIGRLRDFAPVDFVRDVSFVSSVWEVNQVVLYQSKLYPEGPIYKPLVHFNLTF